MPGCVDAKQTMANMDRFASCMIEIGQRSKNETYIKAGALFAKSGELFQSITDKIVEYVCDGNEVLILFRYLNKHYSGLVDIVPIKGYNTKEWRDILCL